ncbi:MAG: glycerol-3-phosphate 1-O-acyltransferase PlsY [Acidobacteriaceae bacterium]
MTVYWTIAAIAYLLGSIPFGYLLVWAFRKEDIRQRGSGNIGATNVLRSGSRWLGLLTLLLDVGKGCTAVVLARYFIGQHPNSGGDAGHAAVIAAIFAVFGHVFPIWLHGKGGKGVATAFGVFVALAPLSALSAMGMFFVIFALTRYVSLASILSSASFPVFVWLWGRVFPLSSWSLWLLTSAILVPALIVVKHASNIRRLLHGTEDRFGSKKETRA